MIILSIGDPAKVSTWSNVPFFFAEHLEKCGSVVHRVDIGPNPLLRVPYDLVIKALSWAGVYQGNDYFRSRLNALLTNARIKHALQEHPNAIPVFMTFSFAPANNTPFVLFGDRTFAHYIEYFNGRVPRENEVKCVDLESRNLLRASLIISLFPEMAVTLARDHGNKVKYYGNVVNLPAAPNPALKATDEKWKGRQLLFIGKAHYKEGLIRTLEALKLLNLGNETPFHLHVVGLKERDVPGRGHQDVTFHGYLNKANKVQYERYLHLLRTCFLFVNPTPKWASFSASCEAMHYQIPLVIYSYPEFVSTFGDEQQECWFIPTERAEDLVQLIRSIASDRSGWEKKAVAARSSVERFTWQEFASKAHADIIALKFPDNASQ